MRQSQNNRRVYWLPLLCVIWTVPASAQWTTVWTPDSAPAIRTTGADGDTHESKTNCYPCKEWEDYGDNKGKWVYYPAGTEPVICVGDTNDYACKMCDGKGGITNRNDGYQLPGKAPSGAYLKCCGGQPIDPNWYGCCNGKPQHLYTEKCCCEKYVYNPKEQGCCKTECQEPDALPCRLTDNPEEDADPCSSYQPTKSTTLGHVICYNGKPYACSFPQNYPPDWPASIMDTCIAVHEESHKNDSRRTPCFMCKTYASGGDPNTLDAAECDAYTAELECVKEYSSDIPGLNDYIRSIEARKLQFCP